jgi:hypothetical protein
MAGFEGGAPSPTFRSIFGGIALALLLLFAFLNLPVIVKIAGAALAFIPGKIGLMHVVQPEEVMPIDMSSSPSPITFTKSGSYALYTDNYDLLVINDAIVEAGSKPWLKIEAENGGSIQVNLVSRGMAFYDTILAKGRPVATFTIEAPGNYIIIHPTRPTTADIVPDYTSGAEGWITFLFIAEVVIFIIIIRDIWATVRSRRRKAQK